jgi:DNA polymerase III delta prime subunit
MTKIIGQEKLMTILNNYNIMNLPHAMLFIGPKGCGKHLIASYVATKFNLDLVSTDDAFSSEDINSFNYKTVKTLYLIDLNNYTEKQQNIFLKALEDASSTAYFILITNSEVNVLPTVLNRCTKFAFEPYTKEQLEQITNTKINDLAFKIFQTPGKLINLTDKDLNQILDLSGKVVNKINQAPFGNALIISTKINYKDLYNKIDFNLFFDTVEYLALEDFKNTASRQSLIVFNVTNKFKQLATQSNLIKETLMLNYLTTLWEAVQA